jgi:hypothetical protein
LERAITRYLANWNESARPFRWTKSAPDIKRSLRNVTAIYETYTSPIDSRLARQLIASAPDAAQQLSDELRGQSWSETDIGWLQNELAKRFGYLFVEWSRPSQRQVEYAAIDLHRQICLERKWPLVVVFIGLRYCAIQIDMDTTMRPTEQRMAGLTVEEQAAI